MCSCVRRVSKRGTRETSFWLVNFTTLHTHASRVYILYILYIFVHFFVVCTRHATTHKPVGRGAAGDAAPIALPPLAAAASRAGLDALDESMESDEESVELLRESLIESAATPARQQRAIVREPSSASHRPPAIVHEPSDLRRSRAAAHLRRLPCRRPVGCGGGGARPPAQ